MIGRRLQSGGRPRPADRRPRSRSQQLPRPAVLERRSAPPPFPSRRHTRGERLAREEAHPGLGSRRRMRRRRSRRSRRCEARAAASSRLADEPARAVEQRAARACFGDHEAEIRLSCEAVAAGPARRDEAECDVISRADVRDAVPDRLDHARALVAQHRGPATGPRSPSASRTSEWHTPTAAIRTRTSSALGGSSSTSSTATG